MTLLTPTYGLHEVAGTTAIQCLLCGRISELAADVTNRYCGRCKLFHEQVAEARAFFGTHTCAEWPTQRGCALCLTLLTPLCLHHWEQIAIVFRAEIDEHEPQAHTQFMLLGCVRCGTVDAFPAANAALATPRYIESLRRQLASAGWTLPAEITWHPLRWERP